jgi:hypothetical protein
VFLLKCYQSFEVGPHEVDRTGVGNDRQRLTSNDLASLRNLQAYDVDPKHVFLHGDEIIHIQLPGLRNTPSRGTRYGAKPPDDLSIDRENGLSDNHPQAIGGDRALPYRGLGQIGSNDCRYQSEATEHRTKVVHLCVPWRLFQYESLRTAAPAKIRRHPRVEKTFVHAITEEGGLTTADSGVRSDHVRSRELARNHE